MGGQRDRDLGRRLVGMGAKKNNGELSHQCKGIGIATDTRGGHIASLC